jgi:hypothetical protein
MMKRWRDIRLVVSTVVAFVLALLLPCLSLAGSLEPTPDAVDPSGNPVPTMKTLDQIPPSWSQRLQCDTTACPRFEIVMGGEAVLDKETGLVWERSPINYAGKWIGAQWECWTHNTGRRQGWRVPTVQEAQSLADLTIYEPGVCEQVLPCEAPFIFPECGIYWTSTTWWESNRALYFTKQGYTGSALKDSDLCYWCVRGGEAVVDDHL